MSTVSGSPKTVNFLLVLVVIVCLVLFAASALHLQVEMPSLLRLMFKSIGQGSASLLPLSQLSRTQAANRTRLRTRAIKFNPVVRERIFDKQTMAAGQDHLIALAG